MKIINYGLLTFMSWYKYLKQLIESKICIIVSYFFIIKNPKLINIKILY